LLNFDEDKKKIQKEKEKEEQKKKDESKELEKIKVVNVKTKEKNKYEYDRSVTYLYEGDEYIINSGVYDFSFGDGKIEENLMPYRRLLKNGEKIKEKELPKIILKKKISEEVNEKNSLTDFNPTIEADELLVIKEN